LFTRLGLQGERAGVAFHAYSTFMIGSVLFAAGRQAADERLTRGGRAPREPAESPDPDPTRRSLEEMTGLSSTDPERDERLFEDALRRLVASLIAPDRA
jgi:hypothetical protein